ncbi:S1C family serine protease [uncultured Pseudokineococcus sp.]|uniref:S1C family serine protease n=1 Tax=uncultured Pseudokineococcus sp. TaxID=1642928 RepID=UPI00262BA3C7|nr:trypsin-like peptidase domain-containing protein [uncultured Pseudokineococcus sp.]
MSEPGDAPRPPAAGGAEHPSPVRRPSPWAPRDAVPAPGARDADDQPGSAGAPGADGEAPSGAGEAPSGAGAGEQLPGERPRTDAPAGAPSAASREGEGWWWPADEAGDAGRGPLHGRTGPGFPDSAPLVAGGAPVRSRRRSPRALVLVAACLLAGLLGGLAGGRLAGPGGASVSVVERSGGAAAEAADGSVAAVAEAVLPSTVSVEITSSAGSGNGSGFVLSEDGYVVTNNHVVAPAVESSGRIRVLLSDGTRETAEVVGRTSDYDLAVLRIDRTGLVPLAFADTAQVRVGDPVVAVGAPLGLASTVTSGIVSALNRPVVAGSSQDEQGFINAVQTDAAINPGNSGGPLVDLTGAVVGVNSAIAQTASPGGGPGGSIGLGFAIPADQVVRTTTELIEDGVATYPVIGVSLDSSYEGRGVRVAQGRTSVGEAVVPGGPADTAGVEPGDVITAIDDQLVTAPDELIVAIRARTPGEEVVLTVQRGRDAVEVPVVLGSEPSE